MRRNWVCGFWLLLGLVASPVEAGADVFGQRFSDDATRFDDGTGFDEVDGSVVCDAAGRCWQRVPNRSSRAYSNGGRDGFFGRYDSGDNGAYRGGRRNERGWYPDQRRYRGDDNRFVRRDRKTVCDQASQVCYKKGRIDKSETRDAFGDRAGDRADSIRDRLGRSDVFVRPR